MNIDPITFMVATIKSIPTLPADVIVNAELDLHAPGTRAIDIVLEGGPGRIVRDRLDAFSFTLNHFGASKQQAAELAFLVRRFLLETLPGTATDTVAVSDVEELEAPSDIADSDSHEPRFIHRITIFVYEP